jgi:hypothetical protein
VVTGTAGDHRGLNLYRPRGVGNVAVERLMSNADKFWTGQTVWHKTREDFVKIISFTAYPTSVLVEPLDFPEEYQEVSLHLLEKSVFYEHNRKPKE